MQSRYIDMHPCGGITDHRPFRSCAMLVSRKSQGMVEIIASFGCASVAVDIRARCYPGLVSAILLYPKRRLDHPKHYSFYHQT